MDNERAKRILSALIREYIASGEPVPSSLLVSLAGVPVTINDPRCVGKTFPDYFDRFGEVARR